MASAYGSSSRERRAHISGQQRHWVPSFQGLDDLGVAYLPLWKTMSRCTSIRVYLGGKSKDSIVIKSIPGNHQALHTFCKLAQKAGHKLFYGGDSSGVVAYRYMQMLTIRKRETIPEEITATLMEQQSNRCGACGDLLRKFEKHHKQPVAAGGSDDISNLVLLCPVCHASETEKQEQAICCNDVWFESQLSPRMHKAFASLPLPQPNTLGRRSGTLQGRL